jgi:branched-chain amino acid transport system substrate-binding protein
MLLGPLFADQSRAVAGAAGRDRPVLSLSNDDSIAGGNLFVFGITPLQSARAVLTLAVARGHRRVVALVPSGPFGERHAAAVAAVAPPRGLQATTAVADGADVAGLVAGADAAYLPVVGGAFEAQAAALAATGVQVLGSDQWSSIRPEGIPALRGAWFAAPDPLNLQGFLLAFDAEVAQGAGVVAALAHDASELARTLGRLGQQDRAGLLREAGFEGVLGPYRFLPSGLCERRLAVLAVAEGTTTQVAAA